MYKLFSFDSYLHDCKEINPTQRLVLSKFYNDLLRSEYFTYFWCIACVSISHKFYQFSINMRYKSKSEIQWRIRHCATNWRLSVFNLRLRHSCTLNRIHEDWWNVSDRTGTHESIGRRLHQRPTATESHSPENCRNGSGWSPPLRDIATTSRLSRLRFENFESLPGNWLH